MPAEYASVTRQVVDTEASSRSVAVPATYQKVTRTVIDVEALRARGYKFDDSGDIVSTPEGHRVLRAASVAGAAGAAKTAGAASGEEAYVREITVPAEYRTVTRQVIDQPATVRMVPVAATHKTIRRRVVATPARTRRGDDPGAVPHRHPAGDRYAGELARGHGSGRLPIRDASSGGHAPVHA